jgi:hypothetical protein
VTGGFLALLSLGGLLAERRRMADLHTLDVERLERAA